MTSLPASSVSVTKALHSTLRQAARIEAQAAIGEAERESAENKIGADLFDEWIRGGASCQAGKAELIRSFKKGRPPTHRQEAAAAPHAITG